MIIFISIFPVIGFLILYIRERNKNIILTTKLDMISNNKTEIENITNKITQEINEKNKQKLLQDSRETLSIIINPLKEDIEKFKKKLSENHESDLIQRQQLRVELKTMIETYGNEAKNLTNALKSKPKVIGNWGERVLDDILDKCGLQENISYNRQVYIKTDDGNAIPDVIIKLPHNENIIIDSKMSLVNYEKYLNAENENERKSHFENYISDIEKHIKDLEKKDYKNLQNNNFQFLDFILMFIPIEGAYYLTMNNPDLHNKAWKNGIVIVGTYNLIPILKTVSHICRIDQQNKNAKEISRLAGNIYDKLVGIIDDILDIEKRMRVVFETFGAIKTKFNGHGGILSNAEKIKQLGAKTDKKIPDEIIQDDLLTEE